MEEKRTTSRQLLYLRYMCSSAKAGDVHAVRRLIELGATVGAADRRGITPLHVASCQRHVDVVRLLVAAGADPNLKHYSGLDCAFDRPLVLCKSSLEMAAERGFDDVVSALKKERICSSEDQLSRDAIFRLLYSPRSSSSGCVSCPFDAPPLYWRRLSTVKFSVPLD